MLYNDKCPILKKNFNIIYDINQFGEMVTLQFRPKKKI